ncbi:uncharacterized protein [Littorina saxatilis]|uniref:FAD-binding PCMH-type domain-containing protein n=1 Tax=Littorina saxatilis TaxID=31220 RepID=A0AAN9ARV1_9CAEN
MAAFENLRVVCFFLLFAVCLSRYPPRQKRTWPQRARPETTGFPTVQQFNELANSLSGSTIAPANASYENATKMHNMRVYDQPFRVYLVESVEDVQKIMVFAKKHNLLVSVRSSGHSYIGRSTNDDGIIINLGKMKARTFKLDSTRNAAGEATLQSGNSWFEVYKAVDELVTTDGSGKEQRRVIVGGSAHTVAMGGYTQGGGHSPICRTLGLAVDNLLEATLVMADGRKAVVNEQGTTLTDLNGTTTVTNDNSLFWAIRGGGGGTWGVVMDFTFKLHYAPERFRNVLLSWALYYKGEGIGSETMKFVLQQLAQLSGDWGGYLLVSGSELNKDATGSLTLFLNHFGSNDSASNSDVDGLLNHNTFQHQYTKQDKIYNTFLEYEVNAHDQETVYIYLFDSFVQQNIANDENTLNGLSSWLMSLKDSPNDMVGTTCTGSLIGGKMADVASAVTPVNPKFRSGLMAMSCAVWWSDPGVRDDFYIDYALKQRDELAKWGEGVYYNEPAEDLDNWKVQFWGTTTNYDRLLDIKKQWDPDHFFWCHNCVGSDLITVNGTAYTAPQGEGREETVADKCASSSPSFWDGGRMFIALKALPVVLMGLKTASL